MKFMIVGMWKKRKKKKKKKKHNGIQYVTLGAYVRIGAKFAVKQKFHGIHDLRYLKLSYIVDSWIKRTNDEKKSLKLT